MLEFEYARFCDDYGLERIDATLDDHIRNLNVMKAELDKLQQSYIDARKMKMLKGPIGIIRDPDGVDDCTTGGVPAYHDPLQNIKDSNPKDSIGIKKVSMSYVPAPVLAEAALGMMEGGFKYRRHNYRVIGVRASVYYDATMRHLMDYWEGQDIDPDSGLSHLTKAICSLIVWRDAEMQGKYVDDRPPKHANQAWVKEMNKHVEKLMKMYPEQKPPYTEAEETKK